MDWLQKFSLVISLLHPSFQNRPALKTSSMQCRILAVVFNAPHVLDDLPSPSSCIIHSVQRSGPAPPQSPRPSRPRTNRPRNPPEMLTNAAEDARAALEHGARKQRPITGRRLRQCGRAATSSPLTNSCDAVTRKRKNKRRPCSCSRLIFPGFPLLRTLSLSPSLFLSLFPGFPLLCCRGRDQPWLARASSDCRARGSQ
jgi:hypothetical protein